MTGFRFVDEHQAEYRITDLCRLAGVSRSSFYAWRRRGPSARRWPNRAGGRDPRDPRNSRRTYGAPRVGASSAAADAGSAASGWPGSCGPRPRRRARSPTWRKGRHPAMVPAPDLLSGTSPPRLRTALGRRHQRVRLSGRQALPRRHPGPARPQPGRLVDGRTPDHRPGRRRARDGPRPPPAGRRAGPSRRSRQPIHLVEFTNRLVDWGLVGSYGSVGDCFDNAAMEAFWATLKKEIRHIWGPIETITRSRDPHDPVRLHRDLLQPRPPPSRPRPPHPRRGLRCRPSSLTTETPCPQDRGNSTAQYWRLTRRIGKRKAAVAVGHSILVIAWHLLTQRLRLPGPRRRLVPRRTDTDKRPRPPHPPTPQPRLRSHPHQPRRLTTGGFSLQAMKPSFVNDADEDAS